VRVCPRTRPHASELRCAYAWRRRYLSARNIPYLNLKTLDNLNARDILRAKKLVVSQSAMATLKDRYGA